MLELMLELTPTIIRRLVMNNSYTTSTGNQIVDAIGKLNITGNVIPESWFRTVVNNNNKPNRNAIMLLSEIVYWYRPKEERDEITNSTSYKKKFRDADYVQLGYEQLCKKFNLSQKQVREGLKLLESLNVIKRHCRNVHIEMGTLHNVLFIELIPEGLEAITYIDNASDSANTPFPQGNGTLPSREPYPSQNENTYTKNMSENNTKTTTTSRDVVSDQSDMSVFSGLNLTKSDIKQIIYAAQYDIDRCRRAVSLLKQQTGTIRNVTGWLISAVKEDYRPVFKEGSKKNGYFHSFERAEYDFDEIEKALLSTIE